MKSMTTIENQSIKVIQQRIFLFTHNLKQQDFKLQRINQMPPKLDLDQCQVINKEQKDSHYLIQSKHYTLPLKQILDVRID